MPELFPLAQEDLEVYRAAEQAIRARFREGRHHVGAAVRASSGRIYTGIHLQAVVGEPATCAEVIAIGAAMLAGEERIATCVAVRHPKGHEDPALFKVLPPCGSCRDLLADYGGRDAWVILEVDGKLEKARIGELIPLRRWTRGPSEVS
ncbi:MAG: cytidine deaminase [Planctomycetes bacterium]|nr:cytidine deaminase [Planctomycetota bacterium]